MVDALLQISSIIDEKTRNDVVSELPPDIRDNTDRRGALRPDVNKIVEACASYRNGITFLLQILRDSFEGNSIPQQEAERVWAELSIHQTLSDVFKAVTIEETDLLKLYRISLPSGRDPNPLVQSFEDMIDDLSQISQQNNMCPLLEFVERIGNSIDDKSAANSLRQWNEKAIKAVYKEVDLKQLKTRLAGQTKRLAVQSQRPYMLIELQPDANTNTQYSLEFTFWDDLGNEQNWECDLDPLSSAQIPEKLTQILQAKKAPRNIILAFSLPDDLLFYKVDQWKDSLVHEEGITYGMRYPVVIRSLTRIKDEYFHELCRWKWQRFISSIHAENPSPIFWIETKSQYSSKTLFLKLDNPEEGATCMGLTFTPEGAGIIEKIIDTGLTVAFWSRLDYNDAVTSSKIRRQIEEIIQKKPLDQLPESIFFARSNADNADNTDYIGHHLTLLWEDPEHIPTKYKTTALLKAPDM